jgi:hypothetical protein
VGVRVFVFAWKVLKLWSGSSLQNIFTQLPLHILKLNTSHYAHQLVIKKNKQTKNNNNNNNNNNKQKNKKQTNKQNKTKPLDTHYI